MTLRRSDYCVVQAAGHRIELRGNQVLVKGSVMPVSLSGVAMGDKRIVATVVKRGYRLQTCEYRAPSSGEPARGQPAMNSA